MPDRRPKQHITEYTSIAMRVDTYEVETNASLNFSLKLADPQFLHEEDPVFCRETTLELFGVVLFPTARAGDEFRITLRGGNDGSGWLGLTIKDVQKRDEHGSPIFRQRRGKSVPVYEPPLGIAVLEKERGKSAWTAWVTIQPELARDMLVMLVHHKPLFLVIRERKVERRRWIESIALRTQEPEPEEY